MFSEKLLKLADESEKKLSEVFAEIDKTAFFNTQKVMSVFRENRLSDRHFNSTCGYGYNDDGRDLCDKMFAEAFGAEAGFARETVYVCGYSNMTEGYLAPVEEFAFGGYEVAGAAHWYNIPEASPESEPAVLDWFRKISEEFK